jgi:hypothetical protein
MDDVLVVLVNERVISLGREFHKGKVVGVKEVDINKLWEKV